MKIYGFIFGLGHGQGLGHEYRNPLVNKYYFVMAKSYDL